MTIVIDIILLSASFTFFMHQAVIHLFYVKKPTLESTTTITNENDNIEQEIRDEVDEIILNVNKIISEKQNEESEITELQNTENELQNEESEMNELQNEESVMNELQNTENEIRKKENVIQNGEKKIKKKKRGRWKNIFKRG